MGGLFPDTAVPIPRRVATFGFDSTCRLSITERWGPEPLAAWLMCNPSLAGDDRTDPTWTRVGKFSRLLGAGGAVGFNVWPLITPYPTELWRALREGEVSPAMVQANISAMHNLAPAAKWRIVAFGAEPGRRFFLDAALAVRAFMHGQAEPALCYGTTDDGWPLHPLARGKFAIPYDREPQEWRWPRGQ